MNVNFSMLNGMVCGEGVSVTRKTRAGESVGFGFADMMRTVQHRARGAALVQIAQGRPNEYMGSPGIINDLNRTPLTILVGPGPEATAHVKFALEHGADPNLPQYWPEHEDFSPRLLAFEYGNTTQVRLLLDAKADVAQCDRLRMLQDSVRQGSMDNLNRVLLGIEILEVRCDSLLALSTCATPPLFDKLAIDSCVQEHIRRLVPHTCERSRGADQRGPAFWMSDKQSNGHGKISLAFFILQWRPSEEWKLRADDMISRLQGVLTLSSAEWKRLRANWESMEEFLHFGIKHATESVTRSLIERLCTSLNRLLCLDLLLVEPDHEALREVKLLTLLCARKLPPTTKSMLLTCLETVIDKLALSQNLAHSYFERLALLHWYARNCDDCPFTSVRELLIPMLAQDYALSFEVYEDKDHCHWVRIHIMDLFVLMRQRDLLVEEHAVPVLLDDLQRSDVRACPLPYIETCNGLLLLCLSKGQEQGQERPRLELLKEHGAIEILLRVWRAGLPDQCYELVLTLMRKMSKLCARSAACFLKGGFRNFV
jgi:hypothetical protein